jgi:hypothetical protein
VLPIILYLGLLYIVLSLVYTFPSEHGTFVHSLIACFPFGAGLAALGLRTSWEGLTRRLGIVRPWRSLAIVQFGAGLLACLIGITVAGVEVADNRRLTASNALVATWVQTNTSSRTVVMSNDSLGITLLTGRPTVAIPHGDLQVALRVAERFDARFLIVWHDRPQGLPTAFLSDLERTPGLPLVDSWNGAEVYMLPDPGHKE